METLGKDFPDNKIGKRFQERIRRRNRFGKFERLGYEVLDIFNKRNGWIIEINHDSLGKTYLPAEQHYGDRRVRTFYLPSAE